MRGPRDGTEKRSRLGGLRGVLFGGLALVGCSASQPRDDAEPRSEAPRPSAPSTSASASPSAGPSAAPGPGASAVAPAPPFRSDEVFDLKIAGGSVIDGTGAPRRAADVLVRGDRIVFVGTVDPSVRASTVLDASGAVVAPGFVDAHSHADPVGGAASLLAQGVTTIVVGQDGRSPGDGGSIRGYLSGVEAKRPIVNVATLVGHASVRVRANVGAGRPSSGGIAKMAALVATALDEGAVGLSTGLEYDPGRAATPDELTAIAKPVGERGGLIMSHLRSEDDAEVEAAIDELVAQGKSGGARVHVAHLKVVGGKGAARGRALLARLDEARKAGVEVTADWYPYTASYTGLEILFPDFARPPHDYDTAKRDRRAALRTHLRERVTSRNGPEATLFGTGDFAGKTLAAVAAEKKVPFEDVLVDLGPRGASAAYFVMDEALQSALFADPWVMVGSDGGGGGGHPRGAGSFARVIEELVLKRRELSLEEAVRKMTSLPLDTLRLGADRGRVAPDEVADLVIFVPEEVRARASFTVPHRAATGMRHVVVAGQPVIRDGRATTARPGRALRAPWVQRGGVGGGGG